MDYKDYRKILRLGKVLHFFSEISVAKVIIENELKVGDKIYFGGATTNFEMVINSMHISNYNVTEAQKGDIVGIKVSKRVRKNDIIYMDLDSICYPWTGSGFEVRIPYLIPQNQILGYHIFESKNQLNEAWYKEEMF
jgi:putative protease